ncbi:hypothetical protein DVR12_03020 [Chitinophaga silvatica]|uniref:Uncharacterized protein n=1 Tax=Chitinophaga silvatica TaxID=2282649 RepID=A0A3E1YHB9_9BACT|nr:hypothetical protein [Chitinophaga silvatica]RFS26772.1 hypothetical protein DVR12_03020 [Chitinophaga silvatica]
MSVNVITYVTAVNAGKEPKAYAFDVHQIPTGEVISRLDFKVWTKKSSGVTCFFCEPDTGRKFRVTVFKDKHSEEYKLYKGELDFRECPVGKLYRLRIEKNSNGNMSLKEAHLIEDTQ